MDTNLPLPDYAQQLLLAFGDSLDALIRKLSTHLSMPVIIIDPLCNLVASSIPGFKDDSISYRLHFHLNSHNDSNLSSYLISSETIQSKSIGSAIMHDQKTLGYLFVLVENDFDQVKQIESIIQYATILCSLSIYKKFEMKRDRLQFKRAFLFDLLYGNFKQREDIISYGEIWGWDFSEPHVAIVFSLADFEIYSNDEQLMETLLYIIETTLIERNIRPITLPKQNEIIAILGMDSKDVHKRRREVENFVSLIIKQTSSTLLNERLATGVGKIYSNPVDLFRSYQEAKIAFELGKLLNIDIPLFSDLGIERILYNHDQQDLREFFEHILGELQIYDRENRSNLMETLESFAANQYDITQTSKALYLHRNTLRYRLKKIEEILAFKIDDINTKLNITAALKIKQLRRI